MEDNARKKVMRQGGTRDMEIAAEKQKKLEFSAELFGQISCPMEHDKQIITFFVVDWHDSCR